MAVIIRRETVTSTPAFSFQNLERQARAIIDGARRQAAEILARAEAEGRRRAEQSEREARRRGLETGRREGAEQARAAATESALSEARDELDRLSGALRSGLDAFEEGKRRLLAQAESGLIELALSVARRVCKHDAGVSTESALANARVVLEMAQHEHDLELRLNPDELDKLRDILPEVIDAVGALKHVEIVGDAEVACGGCVLDTRDGTIDASIETQLERVAQALAPS